MTHFARTIFLLATYALVTTIAQAQEQELAPLPITPSAERVGAISSISPFAEPIPPGIPPENAKDSVRTFTRQGCWPIRVEYEDGSQCWGEVSEIGWDAFKLLNRKTDQETTLSYAGMRSIGVVKAYGAPSEYVVPKLSARRRLPRPVVLSPQESGYKLAVQDLGVNEHRFVHCDLPKGKVRTGVITEIREDGFELKDGIFATHWISYMDLKAAPRPVPAVGTRISHGFKWTGMVTLTVVLLPFLPLFYSGS